MDPGLNNAGGPAIRDDGILGAVVPVYSFYRPANAFFTVIPERVFTVIPARLWLEYKTMPSFQRASGWNPKQRRHSSVLLAGIHKWVNST